MFTLVQVCKLPEHKISDAKLITAEFHEIENWNKKGICWVLRYEKVIRYAIYTHEYIIQFYAMKYHQGDM